MDAFCEQIIKIKKTKKMYFIQILVWLIAAIITAFCILLMGRLPIVIFLAAASIFGAFKLGGLLNIEYEYIITNGEMDVDKIINKSSRKNVLTFSCKDVEEITVYSPEKAKNPNIKTYVCTDDFASSYIFKLSLKEGGMCALVLSPNEKTIENMKRYIPRSVYSQIF